jgi:hypothetical protein
MPPPQASAPAPAPAAPQAYFPVLIGAFTLLVLGLAYVLGLWSTVTAGALLIPIGAVLATRFPVPAVVSLFFLTGFSGTLLAFTPVSPRPAADLVLVCLWVVTAVSFLSGNRRPIWAWPALVAPALYVLLSLIEIVFTDPITTGLDSFRQSVWLISAMLLVALAPWSERRSVEMVRGAILVGLAVGLYSLYRWQVGAAAAESTVAREALPGVPQHIDLRFFGSQATAQQLAQWFAALTPVAFAGALAWRGRWRLVCAVAVVLCGFAVLASEVRTGAVAVAAGVLVTLLLFHFARAFPASQRIATTMTAILAVGVLVIGGFALTVGSGDGERAERYLRILTPSEDRTYATRTERWRNVLPVIHEEPLGHGLGTSGTLAARQEFVPETELNLDSSYLKIAYEQGFVVMVFFIAAFAALLLSLARRAVTTVNSTRATIGIGACGSLAALLVTFYAGFYIENLQALAAWILVGLGLAQFTTARGSRPGEPTVQQTATPRPEARPAGAR